MQSYRKIYKFKKTFMQIKYLYQKKRLTYKNNVFCLHEKKIAQQIECARKIL